MTKRKDHIPFHQKLGYSKIVEMEQIHEDMRNQGLDPNTPKGYFEAERRYREAHKNDLSYRERQKIWLKTQRISNKPPISRLTPEEIDYLMEKLEGVNHPTGKDILDKLKVWKEETNE